MPRMAEAHPIATTARSRERWLVAALVAAAVVARSAVLVFWEQAQFDSDQAIVGLMAKHLAEGRAFPLFYYGQNYMLGVEAWLAAPLFAVAGASVTALKLPLLAINVLVALLLLRIFEREVGLRPALAAVPALFFVLPPPGTAAHLLNANGGSVEPLAWALLVWLTRHRPALGGVLFAIAFLQREFAIYALAALLAVEAWQGVLFTRAGMRVRFAMLRMAAGVWLFAQWLKTFSSALGPGTTAAQLINPRDNIVHLIERVCLDLQTVPAGLRALVTEHWPALFGSHPQPLIEAAVDSTASQGAPWSGILLAAIALTGVAGVAGRLAADRRWRAEYDVCLYLVLVAACSCAGYIIGRCGRLDLMRYELLSLLGAAGLGAWFLHGARSRAVVLAWTAAVCGFAAIAAVSHGRLLAEYLTDPPVSAKQIIVEQLHARGITYAKSDYWLAYSLTFLTNERVIVASEDLVRIAEYQRRVLEHRSEAYGISRHTWCEGYRPIVQAGVYLCPPSN